MSRINSALIRRINTARVFHALRENPGSSQRRLCALTLLDASTVSSVVAGLEAERVIRRVDAPRSGLAGRPEALMQISSEGGVLVGASVGSEDIRLVACGLSGQRLDGLRLPPARTVAAGLRTLSRGVDTLLERMGRPMACLRGIGVGQHGLIDRQGHLVLAPRLGWRDVALGARLQDLFPVPVHLENDTKAAALAEHMFGACRGVSDFILVHGGSGVGGALYLQGALYHGSGLAGELGHMKVAPDGAACGCGGHGCLEAYVSEAALRARLAERGIKAADADAMAALARRPEVAEVLGEAGWMLGLALADLINLLSPRRIVFAGSLAVLSPFLQPRAREALAANVLQAAGDRAEIIESALGPEAVALGGVALAMNGFLPTQGYLPSPRFG